MSYLAKFYFQVSTTSLLHSVELKADRQTLGQRGWANIPDGLAGGFVLDRGGEGGVSLVLKQEGQRCLRRVWSETLRQIKATWIFFAGSTRMRPRGQRGGGSVTFTLAPVLQQVLVGYREVASLDSPSLAIGSLGWVQLPGRRVGSLVVPHRATTDSYPFVVSLHQQGNDNREITRQTVKRHQNGNLGQTFMPTLKQTNKSTASREAGNP